jgi:DNA-binding CsgD family transcriptional regulator
MDDEGNSCSPAALPTVLRRPSFLNDREWKLLIDTFHLSPRETEVSTLIFSGKSEREIADLLSISVHTVHSHLERMHRKLNVHTRGELVVVFFRTYVQVHQSGNAAAARNYNPEYQSE